MASSGVRAVPIKILRGNGRRNHLRSRASSIGMGNIPPHESLKAQGITRIPSGFNPYHK